MSDARHKDTVWVVEDSPLEAELVRRLLSDDYRVEVSADGVGMLERLAAGEAPTLIVLDLMLPEMSGLEFCEFVRRRWDLRSLPVLILTAQDDPHAVAKGFAAGANDYVSKPYHDGELKARVDALAQGRALKARSDAAEANRAFVGVQVSQEREKLFSLFTHAPAAVCVLRGKDHVCEFANRRYRELVGVDELVGKSLKNALPATHAPELFLILDRVFASGETHVAQAVPTRVLNREPATTVYLKMTYEPSHGASGEVDGVRIFAFDVTDQVVGRRKVEELLSVASHELKTPLTSLKLQIQMLLSKGLEATFDRGRLKRSLQVMERQVQRQTQLINNLLDVSRMSSGKLKVEPAEVDVAELVLEATDRFEEERERSGSELRVRCDDSVKAFVDPACLDQVLTHLLSNALKYGSGRPIEVGVEPVGTRRLRLTVRDHGIGIDAVHLERVFDAFERAVPERHYAGLGLGLWITRRTVESMGGTLSVESRLGEGSTFTVELSRYAASREPARTDESEELLGSP